MNFDWAGAGAGTASVKAKNQVDKKATSSQKSKSHDDDDGGASRKEAQAGIWKQQPHDDIPDVIMNNNNTQHDIPPHDNPYNFTPSELAEIAEEVRLYGINKLRCTCPGSDGLSSCPRYRLPTSPILFEDVDDDMLDLDTMSMYS